MASTPAWPALCPLNHSQQSPSLLPLHTHTPVSLWELTRIGARSLGSMYRELWGSGWAHQFPLSHRMDVPVSGHWSVAPQEAKGTCDQEPTQQLQLRPQGLAMHVIQSQWLYRHHIEPATC